METNSTEEQRLLRVDGNYGVDQIKALEGLEAVRKRPGMYIGSTSQTGIDQTVYEVVDNSFDEYIAGYGKDITITVGKDASISVSDQGRGIPVGDHHEWVNPDGTPMNTLTGILTKLHAGGKFGGDTGYKCFPSETPVTLTTGVKPIAIVKPGDVVVDGHGREREVTDVFVYDHAGELTVITTEDGRRLRAVAGHYVLVNRDGQLAWFDVRLVTSDDQLVELEPGDDVAELERIIPRYDVVKYRGSAE